MEEYPDAILWFTFTGVASPLSLTRLSKLLEYKEPLTPSFIIQGMLEKAKETMAQVKIVSGGMISMGYCHESLADLKSTIKTRNQQFAPFLATYSHLAIGGTIAPWADARKKRGGIPQSRGRDLRKDQAKR